MHIRSLAVTFEVRRIAIEQFGGQYLASRLATDGLPVTLQGEERQVPTQTPARELETRIKHGRFRHDGNSRMTWMASNAVVERRVDGSVLPKKATPNSANKVDGIDALLLGLGELLATPEPVAFEPRILVLN